MAAHRRAALIDALTLCIQLVQLLVELSTTFPVLDALVQIAGKNGKIERGGAAEAVLVSTRACIAESNASPRLIRQQSTSLWPSVSQMQMSGRKAQYSHEINAEARSDAQLTRLVLWHHHAQRHCSNRKHANDKLSPDE